jgi:hypothetical protein
MSKLNNLFHSNSQYINNSQIHKGDVVIESNITKTNKNISKNNNDNNINMSSNNSNKNHFQTKKTVKQTSNLNSNDSEKIIKNEKIEKKAKNKKYNERTEERNKFFNQLSEKLVKSNSSQVKFRVVEVEEVKPKQERIISNENDKSQKIHSEEIKDIEYIGRDNTSLSKISEKSNNMINKITKKYAEKEILKENLIEDELIKYNNEEYLKVNNNKNDTDDYIAHDHDLHGDHGDVDVKKYYKELKTYFNIFKSKAKEVVRNYKNISKDVQGNCYNDSLESLEDFNYNYNNHYTVESNDNILYCNQTYSNNNDNDFDFSIESFHVEIRPTTSNEFKANNLFKNNPEINDYIKNAVNESVSLILNQSKCNNNFYYKIFYFFVYFRICRKFSI